MKKLETLIPPPLVTLGFALVLWLLSRLDLAIQLSFDSQDNLRLGASLLMFMAGGFFCIAGVLSFKRAKTTVNPLKPQQASALVTSGIYQYSRNPMYVGFGFFLIAFSIFLNTLFIIVVLPCFIVYLTRFQIIPEERALHTLFGETFSKYQSEVRRWL